MNEMHKHTPKIRGNSQIQYPFRNIPSHILGQHRAFSVVGPIYYVVLYLALLTVHTNQKRLKCERPREKRPVLRERKEVTLSIRPTSEGPSIKYVTLEGRGSTRCDSL